MIFWFLLLALFQIDSVSAAAGCPTCPLNWSYIPSQTVRPYGPYNWNQLYPLCGSFRQSPINIVPNDVVSNVPLSPIFAAPFSNFLPNYILNSGFDFQLGNFFGNNYLSLDNGQGKWKYPFAFNGKNYYLDKVAFTAPGGHQVNFASYDMEIQIMLSAKAYMVTSETSGPTTNVFNDQSSLNIAIPVLSIPVGGNPNLNKFLQAASNILVPGNIALLPQAFAIDSLLPFSLDYFYYQGSQVVPPCTQTTDWIILTNPIQAQTAYIDLFRATILTSMASALNISTDARVKNQNLANYNNRPVQPMLGRKVALYGNQPANFLLPGQQPVNNAFEEAASTLHIFILSLIILFTLLIGFVGLVAMLRNNGMKVDMHLKSKSGNNSGEDSMPLHPMSE